MSTRRSVQSPAQREQTRRLIEYNREFWAQKITPAHRHRLSRGMQRYWARRRVREGS